MKSIQNIKMNNQTSFVKKATILAGILSALTALGQTQNAAITVQVDQVLHSNSPYLTGACIEDVNHEIYGGLDSQMIFGESFAEPATQTPLKSFKAYEGHWTPAANGSIQGTGGDGAKIIWNGPRFSVGEVSVDVMLTEAGGGNGGLILKVEGPDKGADAFTGYEVSLERPGFLVLGRHRQNWEPIRRVPCDVPVNQWINLTVRFGAKSLEVLVNGKGITQYDDDEHPLESGALGLRIWQSKVLFRNFSVGTTRVQQKIPFEYAAGNNPPDSVSGMWRAIRHGAALGSFSLENQNTFSGSQSQKISFTGGSGEIGVANQSLKHWGMNFVKGKPYEGYLWARAESPAELFVALESRDGTGYAEKSLKLKAGDWQRLDFTLEPITADTAGQFAIKLKQPGTVTLGYAFLQPGAWGRFKNLPVRKAVAEGLINQGVTLLRYGGSMVNNPEYRWKKMIGPRAQRPPYEGHWYLYSSDGWGIFDFLNLCEAAGIVGVPDLDINESPKDMADFMDYLNGTPDSEWGKRRVADGHPAPYGLKYIELGNEERVDDNYFEKFKAVAEVIWAKDPAIILTVGDFSYHNLIAAPFDFAGADSGITTLAAQQKILKLAKQHNREVWFDLHVWTDGPRSDSSLPAMFSYFDAMDKIADGAKHKVVVFELNANNHSQRRALANALAINAIQRDGRLPITSSANCLQPDGQNDNGWDQGLLFLNSSQVWLQPPGYVTQMISQNCQPLVVKAESPDSDIDVSATKSEDGKNLVLQIVNLAVKPVTLPLKVSGFVPGISVAQVLTLEGALDACNTAGMPEAIKPVATKWKHGLKNGETTVTFPARSFTVIRL
jgi:alpha-L-arabinofuranosidase